jgi:hypothetical protein
MLTNLLNTDVARLSTHMDKLNTLFFTDNLVSYCSSGYRNMQTKVYYTSSRQEL